MCPIKISELKNPQHVANRVGGKKIEFETVIHKIVASKLYWSVSEVHEQLVMKKVSRMRTLNLLNKASKDSKLDRLYDDSKYFYGPVPVQQATKTGA